MKIKLLLLIAVAALIAGCATKNPDYVPGNTNGIPAYIPDPRINAWSNQVAGVTQAIKPANPYAGITDYAVATGFGIVAAVAGLIARRKSQVADTMAAGAVKAGPEAVQSVLDHAAEGPHFAAVASLVNANTGANQTTTGETVKGS